METALRRREAMLPYCFPSITEEEVGQVVESLRLADNHEDARDVVDAVRDALTEC